MEKRQKIREKRHEAYLRRKSTGWQATYYWKNKRARKEKMDAAKEAIRAEDQAKGIYYHPKQRKEQKDEEKRTGLLPFVAVRALTIVDIPRSCVNDFIQS